MTSLRTGRLSRNGLVRARFAVILAVVVLCGLVVVTGVAGVAAGDSSGSPESGAPAALGSNVVLLSDQSCDPDEDAVVVRFEDEHVVSGAAADDCPSDPHITTDDGHNTRLVVTDGIVQTETGERVLADGNEIHQLDDADPDLVVADGDFVNSSLVVGEDGRIVLEDDEDVALRTDDSRADVVFSDDPELDVTITETNSPGEGEQLDVTVEIDYVGYYDVSEDLQLKVDNGTGPELVATTGIDLEQRETKTVTLEYETQLGDASGLEVIAFANNVEDQTEVNVDRAGVFVEIIDSNRPAEGDELEVTAEIERVGDLERHDYDDPYLIEFFVDDARVSGKAVDPLDSGSSTTETFTYQTVEGDGPEIEATIDGIRGDSDTKSLEVVSESAHEGGVYVNITDSNAPEEGDDLEVTAEIGHDDLPDGDHEYQIEFLVDGSVEDTTNVTLSGPGSDTVTETFSYETDVGDAPRIDVDVTSPGDDDSTRPRIYGSGFQVEIIDTNAPVNESERLRATVTIENTGDVAGEQNVRLIVDQAADDPRRTVRSVRDNATVSLDAPEVTTERFSFETTDRDPSMVELIVRSENDEDRINATVRPDSPFFEISEADVPSSVAPGEEMSFDTVISNVGSQPGTQYVDIEFAGESAHIDRVSLDAIEETSVSSAVTAPDDPGTYEYTIRTANDTVEGTIDVGGSSADDDDDGSSSDSDSDDGSETDGESTDTETETETASETETSPADDDRSWLWLLLLFGTFGVLCAVPVWLVYRNDPDDFPPEPAEIPTALQEETAAIGAAGNEKLTSLKATDVDSLVTALKAVDAAAIVAAAKRAVGLGTGTLIVQNELPKPTTVRIRCQTADDTVLLEDLTLDPDERRELGSLPTSNQFKVGAGVEDITSHEEVFDRKNGNVGVVLRPEGIVIGNW
ncbi:hypothetical protein GS429_06975 [Natronorubrum sp. JWXQ-INN-674]|uniref:CARDB domain-containing protein n=1 Tax=Natronorubrum halalkaliphilum TaxID=2691917 RepID=A0A6B0VIY4_9EURY|nr:hypothetical protein [Natronorubrum halalkaliphilum]MXV61811.1 hypothetical protein [Natronorubrum halalkaliphilum]